MQSTWDTGLRDSRSTRYPEGMAAWDQTLDEPLEAFTRFMGYMSHPDPDVRHYIRDRGLPRAETIQIAARYRWAHRRKAFEAHCLAQYAEAAGDRARKLGEKNAEIVALFQDWILDSAREARAAGKNLNPKEMSVLVGKIVELGRLLAGESTAKVDLDVRSLDDRQLAEIEAILLRREPSA